MTLREAVDLYLSECGFVCNKCPLWKFVKLEVAAGYFENEISTCGLFDLIVETLKEKK